jgi:SPP1 family phage portal protein
MPWFDGNGDMIAFGYGFNTKIGDKEVKNVWIYTKENCIKLDNSTGKFIETENKPHGFTKIPIVYVEQDFPEWEDAKELIDRYEVSISKLADSNDYTAHPIMIVEGKVTGAPVKEEVGKVFNIPIDYDDQGKERKGDIRFLKNEQAPEAVKLEFETILNDIHSITSTPNISFDNVKSIGTVSGIALKLLFLDAIIKAKSNEGENRTMYERIINIIISGVIKTINTKLIKESTELRYDIQFNSILPDDLKTAADVIKTLRDAGVISKKTSIQYLKMVDNVSCKLAGLSPFLSTGFSIRLFWSEKSGAPRNKVIVEFFLSALPNSWYSFSASNIERIISCSPTEILNVLVIEICISEIA